MAESGGKNGKYWYWYMIEAVLKDLKFKSVMLKKYPKLKSGEPQLRFQVETLKKFGASLDLTSQRVKNNQKSQEYRNNGNDLFKSNGDAAEVARMYTQSIAYALPGSRELALAYANRSAVSFQAENYEDCLLDIERSLENDYPEEMKGKLYDRRDRCLLILEKPQNDVGKALQDTREALSEMDLNASVENLLEKMKKNHKMRPAVPHDDNCDILGATGIKIEYSKKYGRHIVATRDIRPGEIIAVTDVYVNARSPDKSYRECTHCTNETTVGIPCDHCVNVIYCSTSCRDKAWKDYHEIECPILGVLLDLEIPPSPILGVKITLKAIQEAGGVAELKKMLEEIDSVPNPRTKGFTGNVFDCTKYASIYTLAHHAGRHVDESFLLSLVSTFTVYYLATRTEIFGQKYHTDLKVFDKNPLLGFLGGLIIRNSEIVQMTSIGVGVDIQVSPFTALCNHNCDSNLGSLGNNKSVAIALKPIKAGEQILDNYLNMHYSRFPKAERQQKLKEQHFFICDCVACIEDWPMLEKLPSALEMPGLSPTIRAQLSKLEATFLTKLSLGLAKGDMWSAKDELVELLESLHEHTCPCQEIMNYRQWLVGMFVEGLDLS